LALRSFLAVVNRPAIEGRSGVAAFQFSPCRRPRRDDEIIALLAESWPRCFMSAEDRRLPLKVGMFHDLKAALGGKVLPDQLSRALGTYCSAPDYQRRLKDGAARLDLDGQRAGTVTPSEAMWARAGRAERRDRYQRKRASAVKRSSLADLRAAGARRKATGGEKSVRPTPDSSSPR